MTTSEVIAEIKSHHPGTISPAAEQLMDAAILHQRISELEKERDAWKECADDLREALFTTDYGCGCGHPACKQCRCERVVNEALSLFDKLKGEMK